MTEKWKKTGTILWRTQLTEDIVDLWIAVEEIAAAAHSGQFVTLYCKDGSRLLPRPISICETDAKEGRVRLVFRVAGAGTREFFHYAPGDAIEIMGPLGNGFTCRKGSSLLMGGGIGIPPMVELSKELLQTYGSQAKITAVLGYRDQTFLCDAFPKEVSVVVATEDGSAGVCGNVLDAVREQNLAADQIYACGPLPMLRGIQSYAKEYSLPAQISMEEKMACGIGACLACVCKSKETDAHSKVRNKRVCAEGPVFDAEEIEL